jgi:hypothetical protein
MRATAYTASNAWSYLACDRVRRPCAAVGRFCGARRAPPTHFATPSAWNTSCVHRALEDEHMTEQSLLHASLGTNGESKPAGAERHANALDRDRAASMADEGGVSAAEMDLREQFEDSPNAYLYDRSPQAWIRWGVVVAAASVFAAWLVWRRRV